MRKFSVPLLCAVAVLTVAVQAQTAPPFFGGGGGVAAFDPEISVINSGVLLDAQVVVSEDRRYVTINMRTSLTRVQSLDVFQIQQAQQGNGGAGGGPGGNAGTMMGYVGNAGMIEDDEVDGARAPLPTGGMPVSSSPSQILTTDPTAHASVLRKEGMFKISVKR